jgi:hypothetical protein
MTDSSDTMRWARRGVVVAILVIGWLFIAWQNHFRITAPTAFVCIGYLAVILTIYNLWRTGAATVDTSEDEDDSTWAKPAGALGELEREKRTLLKAIKEAEFDRDMGKLSPRDADEMIRGYRVRAIEVIKQIDQLGLGAAGTVREQILREVRARAQLDARAGKKPGAEARPGKARPEARPAGKAAARAEARTDATPGVRPDAGGGAEPVATPTADADSQTQAPPRSVPRDEDLDADSTTALEPRHDEPAGDPAHEPASQPSKEATP